MKITIEIPDTTACVFVDYVFMENTGMSMASKPIDTNELRSGKVIDCAKFNHPTEKGCGSDGKVY